MDELNHGWFDTTASVTQNDCEDNINTITYEAQSTAAKNYLGQEKTE